MYDIGSLLAIACEAADTFLNRLAVAHKHAGHGELTERPIEAGLVTGHSRSLGYSHRNGEMKIKKTYIEGVMSVTPVPFSKREIKILDKTVDGKGVGQTS